MEEIESRKENEWLKEELEKFFKSRVDDARLSEEEKMEIDSRVKANAEKPKKKRHLRLNEAANPSIRYGEIIKNLTNQLRIERAKVQELQSERGNTLSAQNEMQNILESCITEVKFEIQRRRRQQPTKGPINLESVTLSDFDTNDKKRLVKYVLFNETVLNQLASIIFEKNQSIVDQSTAYGNMNGKTSRPVSNYMMSSTGKSSFFPERHPCQVRMPGSRPQTGKENPATTTSYKLGGTNRLFSAKRATSATGHGQKRQRLVSANSGGLRVNKLPMRVPSSKEYLNNF